MSQRTRLVRSIRRTLEHRAVELGRRVRTGLEELALRGEEERGSDEEGAISLLRLDSDELERIARALTHISQGSFGACDQCGSSIPDEQLVASPLATCCPGCGCGRITGSWRRDERIPA